MRRAYKKHKIAPDGTYNDVAVAQFINKVMKEGKKTIAQKIVYGAFEIIKEKTKKTCDEKYNGVGMASPLTREKIKVGKN